MSPLDESSNPWLFPLDWRCCLRLPSFGTRGDMVGPGKPFTFIRLRAFYLGTGSVSPTSCFNAPRWLCAWACLWFIRQRPKLTIWTRRQP
jgi:hypothetical protein